MQSSKNNSTAEVGIKVFGALSAILLLVRMIIGSTEMDANFMRPFLIGLRNIGLMLFGNLITILNDWYEGWLLAPLVVLILQCVPFAGLALSICVRFGLLKQLRLPSIKKQLSGSADRAEPPSAVHSKSGAYALDRGVSPGVARAAMERLNRLQAQCADTNPFEITCAIRVQYLDDVSENNDYVLRLEPGRIAVIPVSGKAEVNLKLLHGAPHIVGVERIEEHGKFVCRENDWSLTQNEPMILYRQGSSKCIKRIAITWLGDGNS